MHLNKYIFCNLLVSLLPLTALAADSQDAAVHQDTVSNFCFECHNAIDWEGQLALDLLDVGDVGPDAETWETVVNKLRGSMMPPPGQPRPDQETYLELASFLEDELDRAALQNPNPGRPGLYRLNRNQYAAVIRDLLGMDIDMAAILPPDTTSYGFDNIADVLNVSPTLLEGYLAAADRVSAIAVGDPEFPPEDANYTVSSMLSQDKHIDGFPLGTRGGISADHNFPLDGIYEINTHFLVNSLEVVKGLQFPHQFEVSIDGERVHMATIGGIADYTLMLENGAASTESVENRSKVRIAVPAGVHNVTVTFLEKTQAYQVDQLQPFEKNNFDPVYVGGIPSPARVNIRGPFNSRAPSQLTRSREAIFSCYPDQVSQEQACAEEIVSSLARQAYRRPIDDTEQGVLMNFFLEGRESKGSFDGGIQMALRRMLMSPNFLFRIERDHPDVAAGESFAIDDLELASRLSFFLWSSIPDEELISIASSGRLSDPQVLEQQVNRMLADERSNSIVENFAGQWLQLRNLDGATPDEVAFPNFDENLRRAFVTETSMFFESIMREDRNVVELMTADYTYVNERLARHYSIPGVYGDHFRFVELDDPARGGLLGQGSILTVTSFAHRTSPVLRGKFVLDNILGTRASDPPDNVPALEENANDDLDQESLRDRLARHRADPACSSCHNVMDPIGLAMEKFDAIGRWRDLDEGGLPIDSTGELANGTPIDGPIDLKRALTEQPELFVNTFTNRLLTYAIGRGLEYYDMPTVRAIVDNASEDDYRFSAIVKEIVKSAPFRMKQAAGAEGQIAANIER
jgi:hypothetical protein